MDDQRLICSRLGTSSLSAAHAKLQAIVPDLQGRSQAALIAEAVSNAASASHAAMYHHFVGQQHLSQL